MDSQKTLLNTMEKWAGLYLFRSINEFFNYLKMTDLSMLQAHTLTYIFYKSSCKTSDLGDHLLVSPPAVSQMVDRLEKRKLVERLSVPGDRRVRQLILTEKGVQLVKESIAARQHWMQDIPDELSEEEQGKIIEALDLLIAHCQKETEKG
ncbi:MAG: MarR family transcriptional regulator [Anaerolineaceae bacterium]|nr:MarR family transcriptional regulator [Anaerolineaceae bacterium]